MKLREFIQSMTAAAVASAMMLSLSVPALAFQSNEQDLTGCDFAVRAGSGQWIKVSETSEDILGDESGIAYRDGVITSAQTIKQQLVIEVTPGKTVDVDFNVENNPTATESLYIYNARNVTLNGSNAGEAAMPDITVECSGSLTVSNTADGGWAVGILNYTNRSDTEMVLRIGSYFGAALEAGSSQKVEFDSMKPASVTVKKEATYALTVENGCARDFMTERQRTAFYEGEPVEVYANRPTDALEFEGWNAPDTVHFERQELNRGIFCMPNEDIMMSARWKKANNTEMTLVVTWDDEPENTVTLTPSMLQDEPLNFPGTVTYENGTFTIAQDSEKCFTALTLQGLTDPDTGELPSVVLEINRQMAGSLIANGVKDVTMNADIQYAPAIKGDAVLTCSGDVTLTNTSGGCVFGDLTIYDAQNVNLNANLPRGTYADYAVIGNAEINCTGDVNIENSEGGCVYGVLTVYNAQDVNVTANNSEVGGWSAIDYGAEITCSGDVKITNASGNAVRMDCLTVHNARNVTIAGRADNCALVDDTHGSKKPHVIHCSGVLTLQNSGNGGLFNDQLTYMPHDSVEAYDIEADGEIKRESASGTTEFTCGRFDTSVEEWNNDLSDAHELRITPTLKQSDPVAPDTDGSGSALGAVVAGVAIGGTVLFVGYEVVTDIILGDLLPEGTAVPVNRGQLAVQIWTNAGRPEPEHQPVFTDVNDAETAKAAQWCVEQGFLSAESGSFRPDSWTPKFRVIEVWKKAFPQT